MNLRNILSNERGQVLPFMAIGITLIILFGTLNVGLSATYKDRANIRDALDAAASSALSPARVKTKPTYYGERYHSPKRDPETGEIIRSGYYSRTTGYQEPYIALERAAAEQAARFYFNKNMSLDGMEYSIKDWDLTINLEPRTLQVVKRRPHTDGVTTSWDEPFPRWVTATLNVRIETPVPWGTIVDTETVNTRLSTRTLKEMK